MSTPESTLAPVLPDAQADVDQVGRVDHLSCLVVLENVDQEKREVSGRALPYGEVMERPDWITGALSQVFEVGSAEVQEGAPLFYGHDHLERQMPIGAITSWTSKDDGLHITAKVSKTTKGDDVMTLLRDQVIRYFSVGYAQVANVLEDAGTEDAILRHTKVLVMETSVVPDPQYRSAQIESVLDRINPNRKDSKMTGTETLDAPSKEDFQGLSTAVEDLTRQVATLGQEHQDDAQVVPASSYGEFLQMLANSKSDAHKEAMEFLAYVGGVVGDLDSWVKDSWVGDIYQPLTEKRRLLNFFEQSPLPSTGMNVEYGKLLADTTAVAEQVAEGDPLAYGKITFTTATAPLKTYGGWGEMSRQEIERSAMAVVEKFFQALVNRYLKVTEGAVRTAALADANSTATATIPDLATADGWIDFIVDAAFMLDDEGLTADGLIVPRQGFKDLAKLRDGDNADAPRLLDRNSGSVNVTGLSGEVFNLPVIPVNSPGALPRVASKEAIRSFEAGGAPFRLQDSDITNLTEAFSIYGYLAVAPQISKGIIRPKVA